MKQAQPASSKGEAPPGSEAPSLCASVWGWARCSWQLPLSLTDTGCVWHGRLETARSKLTRCAGRSWLPAWSAAAACCHQAKRAVQSRAGLALGKTGAFSAPVPGIPCTAGVKDWKEKVRTRVEVGGRKTSTWKMDGVRGRSGSPASLLAREVHSRWH